MRSHLLYIGVLSLLLTLLPECTYGQYGGDVYFPEYDGEDDYGGGYNSRPWPPRPSWQNKQPRPNEWQRPGIQTQDNNWRRPGGDRRPDGDQRPGAQQPSNTKNPTRPSTGSGSSGSQNDRSLPLEDCGTTHAMRILGGEVASPGQYPWSALLQYRNRRGQLSFECGGALINKRYVLTAAHCLHKSVIRDYTLVNVRLGELDTSKAEDCIDNECADPPIDFGVENQVLHPDYTGRLKSKNDIALIRLNRDAPTTDFIRPICLPIEESARSSNGGNMIVSGWGITESRQRSQQLRYVAVPNVDVGTCSSQLNENIDSSQLCAGGEKGKDSCKGDSGGPLIEAGTINSDNRFIIKGLVSFGPKECGSVNKPGVYTRVSAFTDWILRTIS